jgi:hypothetical protein
MEKPAGRTHDHVDDEEPAKPAHDDLDAMPFFSDEVSRNHPAEKSGFTATSKRR